MARRSSRDLTGAVWGEPWESKPRVKKSDPYTYSAMGTLPDGSRVRRTGSGATIADALASLERAKNPHLPKPSPAKATVTTLRDLFESWWKLETERTRGGQAARALSESTLVQYRDMWRLHLEPDFGDQDCTTITHTALYDWLHTPRSIMPKYPLDTLRAIYKHAQHRGLVTESTNPTRGGFELASVKPDPKPMPLEWLDVIETHLASMENYHSSADDRRLHDSFVTMRATGLRISEVLALRSSSFDPTTRRLTVSEHLRKSLGATGEKNTYAVAKGSKTLAGDRTVVVPVRVAELLAARAEGRPRDAFLFPTRTGKAMSTQNWRSGLSREIVKINAAREARGEEALDDVHPHRLRVTVASAIVRALVDRLGLSAGLEAARKQLGHKTTKPLVHYVVEEVQVEDHSAILDELDSVMVRERIAREVVAELTDADVFLELTVVRSDREVFVTATQSLEREQREHVQSVLSEHDLRLLV